ncbi:MAG: type VI secretion system tip protein VgrG, partial [Deltaproteobacteria bacterium]|nr:type VI secretion system tip protein VgrG [Deltaproteobacteria bacterium]
MALLGSNTTVTGPFPAGVLLLETLSGTEELGAPYAFQLGLLSENPAIDPDGVLGKPLGVGFKLAGGNWRHFHGIVTSFAKTGTTHLHTRYSARLNPFLSESDYTSDCRVFNEAGQDAVSIATAVLAEDGLFDVESGSLKDHVFRGREYCVQYRESDLNFVQRLLEEEGIYYFFRHEAGKHVMVLADSIVAHEAADGYESVLYAPKERQVAGAEEHFWEMQVRKGLYPGRHTVLSGYDPTELRRKQPVFGEEASAEAAPGVQFEHYDYPGGLFAPAEARCEAMVRLQSDRVAGTFVEVRGNTTGLGVGALVTLRPSPKHGGEVFPFWAPEDFGNQYLIVAASYQLSVDQYETGEVAGRVGAGRAWPGRSHSAGGHGNPPRVSIQNDEPFQATYLLLDSHIPYRPARIARKPRMPGPQTALVVGPPGEEIWTDSLGRVRVQFDWDRLGQ